MGDTTIALSGVTLASSSTLARPGNYAISPLSNIQALAITTPEQNYKALLLELNIDGLNLDRAHLNKLIHLLTSYVVSFRTQETQAKKEFSTFVNGYANTTSNTVDVNKEYVNQLEIIFLFMNIFKINVKNDNNFKMLFADGDDPVSEDKNVRGLNYNLRDVDDYVNKHIIKNTIFEVATKVINMASITFYKMKETFINSTKEEIDKLSKDNASHFKDINTLYNSLQPIGVDVLQLRTPFNMLHNIMDFFSNTANKDSIQYNHDEDDENKCRYTVEQELIDLLTTSETKVMFKYIHETLSSILGQATTLTGVVSIIIDFVTVKICTAINSATISTLSSTRTPIRQEPQDGIRVVDYGTKQYIKRDDRTDDVYTLNANATDILMKMAIRALTNIVKDKRELKNIEPKSDSDYANVMKLLMMSQMNYTQEEINISKALSGCSIHYNPDAVRAICMSASSNPDINNAIEYWRSHAMVFSNKCYSGMKTYFIQLNKEGKLKANNVLYDPSLVLIKILFYSEGSMSKLISINPHATATGNM